MKTKLTIALALFFGSGYLYGTSDTASEKEARYKFGGNLVQSYTFNAVHPNDGYNGTMTWTDRANEYQLNQAWSYFEIPTDTSKKEVDWGGRIDLMFGSSYRWITSSGLEDKIFKTNTGSNSNCTAAVASGTAKDNSNCNTVSSQYGLAIPQAYFDVAYKNFKLRIGHIVSPVGFYTVDTTQNFFAIIPYTYQYGEPFTHWGAWVYFTVNDKLNVMGGITRGGDNFDGSGTGAKLPGFLGTASYTFDDKSTLDWVVHISKEYNYKSALNSTDPALVSGAFASGAYNRFDSLYSWRYFQTLVYKRDLTTKLQWIIQSDFGIQKTADIEAALTNAKQLDKEIAAMWYGINTYIHYTLADTLKLGFNLEWFRDQNGVRVGSALPTMAAASTRAAGMGTGSNPYRGNYIGNFFAVMVGPRWQVQKNTFLRLMARYDYFDGVALNALKAGDTGYGQTGGSALPFKDGDERGQLSVGIDLGYIF
ncbi:MAG: hypothetical protein LDLANPLL_02915 [Turneriella sp.]|nr:hypothetical protein [Turneriella sp.]